MDKKSIKVGVVGFGMSGKLFHTPFIHADDRFELAKVVERHREDSKTVYSYVEVVKDFKDVLEDETIDLVVITTPNSLHFAQAKQAILAGKHIVVEKPFTATAAEAQVLIDLAEAQDCRIFVYQNRRWDGDFLTVKKVVDEGLLGELLEYEAHFDRYATSLNKKAWKESDEAGLGLVYDLGTHLIDQVVSLFGSPKSVWADIRSQREKAKVDDAFEIVMDYGSFKATAKASLIVREQGPRYILHGRKGSFIKYGIDPQEEDLKNGLRPVMPGWGSDNPENFGTLNAEISGLQYRGKIETIPGYYQGFYENVWAVLTDNAEMLVKPEEARDVIDIIEKAYESHREKRVVEV